MTRQAVGEISMPIPRADFQGDTDGAPSPWGEGRDEGGRDSNLPILIFKYRNAHFSRIAEKFKQEKVDNSGNSGFVQ